MTHQFIDVADTFAIAKGVIKDNTEEEKQSVMRIVCGANACHNKDEAFEILEMLGLVKRKE